MAIMRIVKNNNFSIVSNAIIRGQNVPKSGDKMVAPARERGLKSVLQHNQ